MATELTHKAELRAQKAQEFEAFGGLNLRHIKSQIYELLRHIGENGIFETYTRHDSAHIEAMLAMADWIVPEDTTEQLTSADWLLIVLSIYLHDLGMLVTREEFQARETSTFPEYRRVHLESNDADGRDYTEKVKRLPPEERERFLYQEFVRRFHANRIRAWIDGAQSKKLGAADQTIAEIAKLLEPLGTVFRNDLGLVCESHHENDLDDLEKYPVRRHYGALPGETANIQYAAIVLRTVDLLQVTRDRTPSIAFRVLNPADPTSQEEWAKQLAVRAITEQPKKDRDGNVDLALQPDTVEIHAHFDQEDGFFALTSYLAYAREQLEQSYRWARESRRQHGSRYEFPWRNIDESQISTKDFLPKQYGFDIDQGKVLDLLTGHTLYNDSSVVLRELTQNAVDAVRLQHSGADGLPSSVNAGEVKIRWDSRLRVLEVQDNGTGMTQRMIEDNFLKVGSSRYRDEQFVKQYPRFSPISRFGIGVLSTFMLADSVEVITSHPDEPQARQISLRSVHGKYLIRLLDKESQIPEGIRSNGTLVRLTIRASAELGNVLELAQKWFVIPRCKLSVQIDDADPRLIGYENLAAALEEPVRSQVSSKAGKVEIREGEIDGVSIAYAVRWSRYFNDWTFVSARSAGSNSELEWQLGTCIEGVRVKGGTPGFRDVGIIAIANASGPNSPRTNVARSGIDDTVEYVKMLDRLAQLYFRHVVDEVRLLESQRGYSAAKAANEGRLITEDLLFGFEVAGNSPNRSWNKIIPDAFARALRIAPIFVVEAEGLRTVETLEDLARRDSLISITDPTVTRADSLVRQLPGNKSLTQLAAALPELVLDLPDEPMIVGPLTGAAGHALEIEWEPTHIGASLGTPPRLTTRWAKRQSPPSWRTATPDRRLVAVFDQVERFGASGRRHRILYYPTTKDVHISGLDDYDAVRRDDCIYLLPDRQWLGLIGSESTDDFLKLPTVQRDIVAYVAAVFLRSPAIGEDSDVSDYMRKTAVDVVKEGFVSNVISHENLVKSLVNGPWRTFDVLQWESRSGTLWL
ncbi:ATP-binding protein [Actinoplanes sp. NPDC051343]|uniref:HD domain-containing protein n=1 Tax=Actinoplanes sp. NPDC051343 TaxID=3363906 RepID=UPI0037B79C53